MTRPNQRQMKTPLLSDEEAAVRYHKLDEVVLHFQGSGEELEAALGMYIIGRHVGWKVLYTIHSKRTIRKYEEILGIKVREEFPEEGPDADRSRGYRVVRLAGSFWKAITEGIPDKRVIE